MRVETLAEPHHLQRAEIQSWGHHARHTLTEPSDSVPEDQILWQEQPWWSPVPTENMLDFVFRIQTQLHHLRPQPPQDTDKSTLTAQQCSELSESNSKSHPCWQFRAALTTSAREMDFQLCLLYGEPVSLCSFHHPTIPSESSGRLVVLPHALHTFTTDTEALWTHWYLFAAAGVIWVNNPERTPSFTAAMTDDVLASTGFSVNYKYSFQDFPRAPFRGPDNFLFI